MKSNRNARKNSPTSSGVTPLRTAHLTATNPWVLHAPSDDDDGLNGGASALVLRSGSDTSSPLRIDTTAPIVVGVDIPAPSQGALLYAAGQARELGVELIAVRSWQQGAGSRVDLEAGVLAEALAICRAVAPDVPVTGRLVQGEAASVLVAESSRAQLVVLGLAAMERSSAAADPRPDDSGVLDPVCRAVLQDVSCPVALAWLRHRETGSSPRLRLAMAQ